MHIVGIMVIIARFQWVGVIASTSSIQPDATAAAAAAAEAASSPRMQYFIQVAFYLMSLRS